VTNARFETNSVRAVRAAAGQRSTAVCEPHARHIPDISTKKLLVVINATCKEFLFFNKAIRMNNPNTAL
jgi:hypothetical protein